MRLLLIRNASFGLGTLALGVSGAMSLTHSGPLCRPSHLVLYQRGYVCLRQSAFLASSPFCSSHASFSSLSLGKTPNKWKPPVVAALEIGGVKIEKTGTCAISNLSSFGYLWQLCD